MAQAEERRAMMERRARMRPRPAGTGWALIVAAVCLVIFIGLMTWVAGTFGGLRMEKPTDSEPVHLLAEQWRARWPSVPGPPARYLDEAADEERAGRHAVAVERVAMALALDPDDPRALLTLVVLSARGPAPFALDEAQRKDVITAVAAVFEDDPLLPAARAWEALAAGDPRRALEATGPAAGSSTDTLEARWSRLRALAALGEDTSEAADLVLALDPGHGEACDAAVRARLASRQLYAVERTVAACRAAGAASPILQRVVATVLERLGRDAEARQAYLAAGLDLHAAAIAYQDDPIGLMGDPLATFAALDQPLPPAALHSVWAGLLCHDEDRLRQGLERLEATGEGGPQVDLARAAALLELGRDREALAVVEGSGEPAFLLLAARALAATGDHVGASTAFGEALAVQPWNLHVHRQRLAWLVGRGEAGPVLAAFDALAALDPVELALYRDHTDRDAPWAALAPAPWPARGLPAGGAALVASVQGVAGDAPEAPPAWRLAIDLGTVGLTGGRGDPGRAAWARVEAVAGVDTRARVALAWGLDPSSDRMILAELAQGIDLATGSASARAVAARLAEAEGRTADAVALWRELLAAHPAMIGAERELYRVEVAAGRGRPEH